MSVNIVDAGDYRIVEVTGEQHGFGGIVQQSRTETNYSRETLEAMLRVRGEMWLRNEIARGEDPGYVAQGIRRQLEASVPIDGQRVLDFGCGCGGSSLWLLRFGATSVVGVEPDADSLVVARLRARDAGLAERIVFHHVEDTTHLPFRDGHFGAVVLNAVVEHIPPKERRVHLQEIWRVLAPGGHLYISETPNRVWPYDGHTTGLWFVPWMPLPLARRVAIAHGVVSKDATQGRLVAEGIRGATYWEIMGAIGKRARRVESAGASSLADFWEATLARPAQPALRLAAKRGMYGVHRFISRHVIRPLGLPDTAFLPEISLCLEKNG